MQENDRVTEGKMKDKEKTEELLVSHYRKYPSLKIQDLFKFLFHSAMGCEHLVPSLEIATEYLKSEYETSEHKNDVITEDLDGGYCRVHLSVLNNGMSAETLAKLFFLSAKKEENGREELMVKLDRARKLILDGTLPLDINEFDTSLEEWKKAGFPAIRHSSSFREEYKPSYRVVSKRFIPYLSLFAEIDKHLEKGRVRVAIDGGSASGKTTLSELMAKIYGCTVFHTDDFFLRPEQRSAERLAEVGGNLDRERFLSEVLDPLHRGESINYVRFNCHTMTLEEGITVEPQRLTVIEGVYSMHPEFEGYYDLAVFLDASKQLQENRIKHRNSPEFAKRFFEEWIPLEDRYFEKTSIKERSTIVIPIV